MNPPTVEYIAGFVDGEGCITIHLNRSREARFANQAPRIVAQVCIANTNRTVLEDIQKVWGGTINLHSSTKYNKNARDSFRLVISEQAGAIFLRAILPHLRLKQEQALLYLRLMELKAKNKSHRISEASIAERMKIADLCGLLNRRGSDASRSL